MDAVLSQTISAIRAGHDVERNFEILFQIWHRQVSAYYRTQGSDPQAADDLMQEVFLTVFARIGDLRDDRAFPAWLFGIARNKWLHHLENQRRTAARQGRGRTPMMKGLYTAASGMNAQQSNIDNIAHNLSNVNTVASVS